MYSDEVTGEIENKASAGYIEGRSWSVQEWALEFTDDLDTEEFPELSIILNIGNRRGDHQEIVWCIDGYESKDLKLERLAEAYNEFNKFKSAVVAADVFYLEAIKKFYRKET